MGPLGELGALFNPGMRHEMEERRSRALRREEEGNARDGDVRIDLDSGVAVINAPARPEESTSADASVDVDQPTGLAGGDDRGSEADTDLAGGDGRADGVQDGDDGRAAGKAPASSGATAAGSRRSGARRPMTKNRRSGR